MSERYATTLEEVLALRSEVAQLRSTATGEALHQWRVKWQIEHDRAKTAEAERDEARNQLVCARAALEYIRDGYERGDINHVDYRVGCFKAALDALSKIDDLRKGQ